MPLLRRAAVVVAAVAAVVWAAVGVASTRGAADALQVATLVLAVALSLGAVVLSIRRPDDWCGCWFAALGVAVAASVRGSGAAIAVAIAIGGMVLVTATDGRVTRRSQQLLVGACGIAGLAAAVVLGSSAHVATLVVEALVVAAFGVAGYVARCRAAAPLERARLQWLGWSLVVAGTVALASVGLETILGVPRQPAAVALGALVLVPAASVLATFDAAVAAIDRVLVRTIVVAGLVTMVVGVYLLVVVGLGHVPTSSDRTVLGLSMVAAGVAALLSGPARRRLEELGNQRVYGERRAPDEPLRTFAGRMSRAIPLDELLLQLAESLHKSLRLRVAEVWTGSDGVLDLVASVPDRGHARIVLAGEELRVVARSHVSGPAWAQVWIPDLVAGRGSTVVRVAAVSHLGNLLGMLVIERAADERAFTDEDDAVLAELARQLGLALHNVRLDSALQASLDELQVRNEELRASRSRIVAASDDSRRQIERNLHDGAQQHLVAMAVKIGLVRQLLETDPATAATMLEELRSDVQETLNELRELAHGIYPPLLRDRGLSEALQTAANRATLDTVVETDGIGRYPEGVETAVYFCCLEAMQNAGKHAGDGSQVTVSVHVDGEVGTNGSGPSSVLHFSVHDDGAGFDVIAGGAGHGFVNMRDRLGAIGGELTVASAPGSGTTVTGAIPIS
jgi:signal transduction histidine kinase